MLNTPPLRAGKVYFITKYYLIDKIYYFDLSGEGQAGIPSGIITEVSNL
jgi:hypothetical protein